MKGHCKYILLGYDSVTLVNTQNHFLKVKSLPLNGWYQESNYLRSTKLQCRSMFMGPLPPPLLKKIQAMEFIDMAERMPETWLSESTEAAHRMSGSTSPQ